MAVLIWEALDGFHERAKVPGGWLVKAHTRIEHAQLHESSGFWSRMDSYETQMSIAFVPDPNHEWV